MRGGLFEGALGCGMWDSTDTSIPGQGQENPPTTSLGTEYKDVIIVGNGPSAICLSYILSGNWPYYGDSIHPNKYLHHRLQENPSLSLLLQDLQILCEGLEGRSNNPVSVLFDTLNHANADLGVETPSFLKWVHHREKQIDHLVLGRGPPGGAWQNMEQTALTLSLSHWMELPNLSFKEWEQERIRDQSLPSGGKQSRALVGNVANYYRDYVNRQQLRNNFRCHCVVTSVRRFQSSEAGAGNDADSASRHLSGKPFWEVRGYSTRGQASFCYVTPHVVLATGIYDKPNRINVPGEDLPFVLHSSAKLEELIAEQRLGSHSDPILVVGAGLTSGDAIITSRFYGVPVVHAFRRNADDPSLIFSKLPENMYPEYHKVHQMMKGGGTGYPGYHCYPRHQLVEMLPGHKVRLEGPCASVVMRVSYVLVLIGSQPDLSFLNPEVMAKIGSDSTRPIDGRHSLITVDAFTNESVREEGLFAVGPLVGDNFVRFIQGGALAIASSLVQKYKLLGFSTLADGKCGDSSKLEEDLSAKGDAVGMAAIGSSRLQTKTWKSWQEEVDDRGNGEEEINTEEKELSRRWNITRTNRRLPRRQLSAHSGCDKTSAG